ncbi:hypothetical protein Sjap_002476 [Stephania japonica]|uniref:DUF4283 domain-containing protein n=1 Tax=Stephania japonica TaxID=461633 RepID=A0AAP0KM56_9MAGN
MANAMAEKEEGARKVDSLVSGALSRCLVFRQSWDVLRWLLSVSKSIHGTTQNGRCGRRWRWPMDSGGPGGRLRPASMPQEMPQHPQEPPISFHIERKFFRVVRRIEGISVSETTPSSAFKVEFTAEETRWLATKSRLLARVEDGAQRKTWRNDTTSLMIDRLSNNRGRALKIWKLVHKKWQTIIVPEGPRGGGWADWMIAIDQMCTSFNARKIFDRMTQTQHPPVISPVPKNVNPVSSRILSDRDLAYQSIRPLREWDFSLIIYRSSLAHSWADISATINIVTHGKEPLQPFGDDRAFLRCTDFRHRETIFGLINQMVSPLVEKVTQWRHEHHWKNPKIGIHNGWISIEGLPLNLWNDVAFKMIGEKFGGLIELAEVTKAK